MTIVHCENEECDHNNERICMCEDIDIANGAYNPECMCCSN